MSRKKAKSDFPLKYILLIKQKLNEQKNKINTHFILQTVREFTNFQYGISVRNELKDRKIIFKIDGLHAPQINIPKSGPATYKIEYEILKGLYEIVITQGNNENKFLIEMDNKKVAVKENQQKKFIDVIIE